MTSIPVQDDPDALPDLVVRALALLDEAHAVEDVPEFLSDEWADLSVADPRRQAALALAAVAYSLAVHALAAPVAGERLLEQHRADLDVALASSAGPDQRFLDESGALAAAVARRQTRLEEAGRPRPGDYRGGRVDWWPRRPAA